MRYCDTSFAAPLIREEAISSRVARFVAGLPTGELAISRWTEVEVASLLARDVRMGVINSVGAGEADTLFGDMVAANPSSSCRRRAATTIWRDATCTLTRAACARETRCISPIAANHRDAERYAPRQENAQGGVDLGLPMTDGRDAV